MTSSPIYKKNLSGFTLIEVLMVIAVISVITVVSLNTVTDSFSESRFEETLQEINAIRDALIGDSSLKASGSRTSFGYSGDIGGLPSQAQGLNALLTTPAGVTAWTISSTARFGHGWNGPYVGSGKPGADFTRDAWGNLYVYDPTSNPATITSLGGDGAAGGTSFNSDITVQIPTSLRLSTVHGFISTGSAPFTGTATVNLYAANGSGGLATLSTTVTAANQGYFSFANVPFGKRSVIAYIPNSTSPTQTLGPITFSVDVPQYVIPTAYTDTNEIPGGGGGGGSGACTTGNMSYVASSGSVGGSGQKTVTLSVNVTANLQLQSLLQINSKARGLQSFEIDGVVFDCTAPNAISPCPQATGGTSTFSPAANVVTGNNKTMRLVFDANMASAASVVLQITHSLGCDTITATGL